MAKKASSSSSTPTSLTCLPDELIAKVLLYASETNFQDMVCVKMTCKTLNRVGGEEKFFKSVPLFYNDIPRAMTPKLLEFRESCLRAGNPHALFLRGISLFLDESHVEVIDGGVRALMQAAKDGFDFAKYAYEILRKEMWPQCSDDSILELGRLEARKIRQKVIVTEGIGYLWSDLRVGPHVTAHHRTIGEELLRRCQCAECVHRLRYWDAGFKGLGMCDRCF